MACGHLLGLLQLSHRCICTKYTGLSIYCTLPGTGQALEVVMQWLQCRNDSDVLPDLLLAAFLSFVWILQSISHQLLFGAAFQCPGEILGLAERGEHLETVC